ncbi:MAG TPA: carboxypeptidase-like regulatory domain-containing protein, partial [Nitrosopumilaceae archaeon]|nr:carboxypeptidase-like regulatory domain-containing protein [Nitrosopumilaceae archaeon]
MKKIKQLMLMVAAIIFIQGSVIASVSGTGEIRGLVMDENHEPVIGAVVSVTAGGVVMGKTVTDVDGKYVVKPLQPGFYDISVQQMGYKTFTIRKIEVQVDEAS